MSLSTGMFRSLTVPNYRLWAGGALVSNVGTWMQRTAQDWIVLTQLTHHSATAVGVVMACQFGPQILLLPLTGSAADRFDRRHILMVTQAAMGTLALLLGLLTVTHSVQLWEVYIFAGLLGCVTAFDAPARQTFVSDLVGRDNLINAVGLNSTSFNLARMVGPAVSGLLTAVVGAGWVFLINAATFAAVLGALGMLRLDELHVEERAARGARGFVAGFTYLRTRPDLIAILAMLFLFGAFGLNFPIFISTMAVGVFHVGAGEYGLLTSAMAVGTVTGALLAARRERPRLRFLLAGCVIFGIGCLASAASPTVLLFGFALAVTGVAAQTIMVTSNTTIQLTADPMMRGRVIAIMFAVVMGSTPIGAPIVGWVADAFGPRWAIVVAAVSAFLAFGIGVYYLVHYRGLRLRVTDHRLRFSSSPRIPVDAAAR